MHNKCRNPGIKHTKPFAGGGGSIFIEFESSDAAEMMIEIWDKNLFGGNEGIFKHQPRHTAVFIKQVERLSEEDIIEEIRECYPDAHVECFKKKRQIHRYC